MSENKMQTVRGTKDLYGEDLIKFNQIVDLGRILGGNYGFKELQTPIFEFSEIFERNLGDASDIISKEVYKFKDRGDNFLTLRPEFTASVIRSFISNGELQQTLPQKFFSYGPVFRYDRPQKGRQRQFNQVNFEIIGDDSYFSDIEALTLSVSLLDNLDILQKTELQINSLGSNETKDKYDQALKEYFAKFVDDLSQDSKSRFEKNPLRILDSKDKSDIAICQNAPLINDFYSAQEQQRFDKIKSLLDDLGIKYVVNPLLVRGLDYYTSLVFEFVMNDVTGAQNTVLAGGRYDNLIEKMSGKDVPAIGFGAGVERLMMLSEAFDDSTQDIAVAYVDDEQKDYAFSVAIDLRNRGFNVDFFYEANFKKQMKKAGQNESRLVLIIGEDEVKNNEINVKDFSDSSSKNVKYDELEYYLEEKLYG